jgi:hypothetical protein
VQVQSDISYMRHVYGHLEAIRKAERISRFPQPPLRLGVNGTRLTSGVQFIHFQRSVTATRLSQTKLSQLLKSHQKCREIIQVHTVLTLLTPVEARF